MKIYVIIGYNVWTDLIISHPDMFMDISLSNCYASTNVVEAFAKDIK